MPLSGSLFGAACPFAQRGEPRLITLARNLETRADNFINFSRRRRMNQHSCVRQRIGRAL